MAIVVLLGFGNAVSAQFPYYGYIAPLPAVPVVPVAPGPYSYFSSPGLGTYITGPGYTYMSNQFGTFSTYSPYAAQSYYWGRYANPAYGTHHTPSHSTHHHGYWRP